MKMAFDLGARQYALENTILGHPIYKNALRDLWASAARARNGPMEGRARILIGGSGDGKTRLLRKMVSEPWAQSDLTGKTEDIIPVKYVEVPSRVTPRELVKTLLEAFGEAVNDGEPVVVFDTLTEAVTVSECLLLLLCNELAV